MSLGTLVLPRKLAMPCDEMMKIGGGGGLGGRDGEPGGRDEELGGRDEELGGRDEELGGRDEGLLASRTTSKSSAISSKDILSKLGTRSASMASNSSGRNSRLSSCASEKNSTCSTICAVMIFAHVVDVC